MFPKVFLLILTFLACDFSSSTLKVNPAARNQGNTSLVFIIYVFIKVVFLARFGKVRIILLDVRNLLGKMLDLSKEETW